MISLGAGLEGKPVVVTGAAGAIGQATAHLFAAVGARVCVVDIDTPKVEAVAEDLEGAGHVALGFDFRAIDAIPSLVERVKSSLGEEPVAVAHLAAVLRRAETLDDVSEDDWDLQHTVNLKAAFFTARAFANSMRTAGVRGAIVNTSSQGWWTGGLGGSLPYNAAKGGIVSLTRGLARTYGTSGIRVNAVAPGFVDTALFHDGLSADAVLSLVEQVPLGRLATAEEAATPFVFLASDNARYITGAVINVSGGFLMY